MGYTHYWTQLRDLSAREWATATADIRTILKQAQLDGIELANGNGEAAPVVTVDHFDFNGVGDDAHETFYITRLKGTKVEYKGHNPAWHFCKTRQKPYDVPVTAVLCYLATALPTPAFSVSSDGDPEDWQAGLALAKKALPKLDVLTVPADV